MVSPPKRSKAGQPPIYTDAVIEAYADKLLEFIKADEGIYINSFCIKEKIHRQRLSEWEKINERFSDAMEAARAWQEEKFLRMALTKEWDSAQVRYTMARVCGDRWKASWDVPEKAEDEKVINVTINKGDI